MEYYESNRIAAIELLLRRISFIVRKVLSSLSIFTTAIDLSFVRRNPPQVVYSLGAINLSPSRGYLQLHENTCKMFTSVLNDEVSDTTKDDSSNLLVT